MRNSGDKQGDSRGIAGGQVGGQAGEGVFCYSLLINLCLAPPLRVKLFKEALCYMQE